MKGKDLYYTTSWIILILAVVEPVVMSQTMLTSNPSNIRPLCSEETIVFTCTTIGSLVLAWMSEEYIGSGSQLELSVTDPVGTILNVSNSDTVANLTAIDKGSGMIILTSTLRIVTRSTTPNFNVSCLNVGNGETNTSTIPLVAVPGVPQNIRAAEVSESFDDYCIILVTWDPPANSDGSDIDHYIVYVPSRNIKNDNETSAIVPLRVPNCHDNIRIKIAAVNIFGCMGLNSSEVRASLLPDNGPKTEGRSNTDSPNKSEGGSNTLPEYVIAIIVAGVIVIGVCAIIILCIVMCVLCLTTLCTHG